MTIVLSTPPYQQFYDANGDPLSGGLIYTYAAGTVTPQATYTDQGGGTPSANPIVLDSAGRSEFWLDASLNYKYIIKDSGGTTIRTIDNVTPFSVLSINTSAWTAYTPTVTAASGTFATLGTVTGRYLAIGKAINIEIYIPITSNGTAANNINATLPFSASAFGYVLSGRANAVSGKMLLGVIQPSASNINIFDYNNAYPGANNEQIIISGVYERS